MSRKVKRKKGERPVYKVIFRCLGLFLSVYECVQYITFFCRKFQKKSKINMSEWQFHIKIQPKLSILKLSVRAKIVEFS